MPSRLVDGGRVIVNVMVERARDDLALEAHWAAMGAQLHEVDDVDGGDGGTRPRASQYLSLSEALSEQGATPPQAQQEDVYTEGDSDWADGHGETVDGDETNAEADDEYYEYYYDDDDDIEPREEVPRKRDS